MADGEDYVRQDESSHSNAAPGKVRMRTRAPEPAAGVNSGNSKKSHRRSINVVSIPDESGIRDPSPSQITMLRDSLDDVPVHTPTTSVEDIGETRNHARFAMNGQGPRSKSPPKDPDRATDMPRGGSANGLEGTNWSGESIQHVQIARRDRENPAKGTTAKLRKHHGSISKPNALSFLDADSPLVTAEGVQRTMKEALKAVPDTTKNTSPSANNASLAAGGFREDIFDVFRERGTDGSASPERSADGDPKSHAPDDAEPRISGKARKRSYGAPEMPRGSVPYPQVPPPEDLTPRGPNVHFAKHPPRTENPPLTGYELLASRLSATSSNRGGRHLRPIYRRFEMLNHRILLHLQDEICELETKLHHLDKADTRGRSLPNCVLPASRRAESMSGSELQWHKTDTIWKIGYKLEQYNRVLSSFRETCALSAPTVADMQQYRGYLASHMPIAEAETQFLDATDDLICLGDGDEDAATEESMAAPMPRPDPVESHLLRRRASILSQPDIPRRQDERSTLSPKHDHDSANSKHSSVHLLVAAAVAIVLPILTFAVIPGFIGRMTVVCLVGMGITGTLVQGKMIGVQATRELCVSIGLYGGVMALLAGMVY
ncbi:hypothetical protein F4861DRAFT_537132 [Xylaria intraflava]|nr:hypothetical protein F4861DRAFT_537132 [Xylaria intraflava]